MYIGGATKRFARGTSSSFFREEGPAANVPLSSPPRRRDSCMPLVRNCATMKDVENTARLEKLAPNLDVVTTATKATFSEPTVATCVSTGGNLCRSKTNGESQQTAERHSMGNGCRKKREHDLDTARARERGRSRRHQAMKPSLLRVSSSACSCSSHLVACHVVGR